MTDTVCLQLTWDEAEALNMLLNVQSGIYALLKGKNEGPETQVSCSPKLRTIAVACFFNAQSMASGFIPVVFPEPFYSFAISAFVGATFLIRHPISDEDKR